MNVSLTTPGGSPAPMVGLIHTVFDLYEKVSDFPLCFEVEAPVAGAYVLDWRSRRGGAATLTFDIAQQ